MFHNIIGVSWSFAQCNRTRLGVDCSNSFLGCCESPFLRAAFGDGNVLLFCCNQTIGPSLAYGMGVEWMIG